MTAPDEWTTKAAFMREVGATYAEWTPINSCEELLTKLTLGPAPVTRPMGPAARMAQSFQASTGESMSRDRARQRHETMFAASSIRPRLQNDPAPVATDDVPRAVRARQDVKRGTVKRKKGR